MPTIRKVTLGLLLTAALAVLTLAVFLLWDYRQWGSLPPHNALELQERVEALTGRVRDMELLVVVLLVSSGLYALLFAATSYFSAVSFARQAVRFIAHIQDQVGLAMGDLREMRKETQRVVRQKNGPSPPAWAFESQVAAIRKRMAGWNVAALDAQTKLELLHYEHAAAYLELAGGSQMGAALADIYRSFAGFYKSSDPARTRFYLNRALLLAPPALDLASSIHYDLACWFAANRDFEPAVRELKAAFQRQSKELEDRLAHDIEEGGELCELASTSPFDKVVNDVLLNVVL